MFRVAMIVPIAVALVLAGGVIACGGDDDDSPSPEPTTVGAQPTAGTGGGSPSQGGGNGGTTVTMVDFGYSPENLTARAGQQVTLNVRNNGQAPHTFTITGVVDSGSIAGGQSETVSFTPSTAGTLQFFCTIHGAGSMSGELTVQ